MYKIFVGNVPIYLTNSEKIIPQNHSTTIWKADQIRNYPDELAKHLTDNKQLKEVYILADDVAQLYQNFCADYTIITAAGGLVSNNLGELLLIYRNDLWDLPKGKVEKKETIKLAAVREVEEETGLENVQLEDEINIYPHQKNKTLHTYFHKKKWVLKPTYWYHMFCKTTLENLKPQLEEGITAVKWVALKDLDYYRQHTYASIRDVLSVLDRE